MQFGMKDAFLFIPHFIRLLILLRFHFQRCRFTFIMPNTEQSVQTCKSKQAELKPNVSENEWIKRDGKRVIKEGENLAAEYWKTKRKRKKELKQNEKHKMKVKQSCGSIKCEEEIPGPAVASSGQQQETEQFTTETGFDLYTLVLRCVVRVFRLDSIQQRWINIRKSSMLNAMFTRFFFLSLILSRLPCSLWHKLTCVHTYMRWWPNKSEEKIK